MNPKIIYKKFNESGPLVVTAIHDGHNLRKEVADIISLHENVRLREEDPFTGEWTSIGNIEIIALQSRFEVDLNRPREKAIYQKPEDAWGLKVWKNQPSKEIVDRSLEEYDSFYEDVYQIFSDLEKQFGHFIVFDLHSYNYKREGPNGIPANPDENPEINIGTGTIDLLKWGPLVERFISDLRNFKFNNRQLDVRENVKFKGGQFSKWIHQTFPESACSISVEFKKFFMDEWTGKPDRQQLEDIRLTLQSTIPGVLAELKKLKTG